MAVKMFKVKTRQEVADAIVQLSYEYANALIQKLGKKGFDKQFWAALHIGFVSGLRMCGYDEQELAQAQSLAVEELKKIELSK